MKLKNNEIVQKLSADLKSELAASLQALSCERAKREGLAPFRVSDIAQTDGENGFPSFAALANSWNAGLVGEVCGALARRQAGGEPSLCFVPAVNVRAHPCGEGASEDPYLTGIYAAAVDSAVRGAGALPCFSALPQGKDASMLDSAYEPRALSDCFLAPLAYLPEIGFAAALPAGGEYEENPNMIAARKALVSRAGREGAAVCVNAAGRCAKALAEGMIPADGDAGEIAAAREEYERLRDAAARGEVFPAELKTACRGGEALSEETIDEAADRAVTLSELVLSAHEKAAEGQEEKDAEELLRCAAEESVVLLANDGILPLREGCSVAVFGVGGEAFCDALGGEGLRCAGFAAGYAPEQDRSDELIPPAAELAGKADVALVFLSGADDAGKFPANRLALLDSIRRVNSNIVAVISPDEPCGVPFGKSAAAILLAGTKDAPGRAALAAILSGRVCPGGKLAASRYADAQKYADALLRGKEEGRFRIGPFVGYRRDEAENSPAAFPFGHGLSYSSFAYSDLKIQYSSVEATIRNDGERDAYETVQLYIGKADSALPRPKKELKGFVKIFLRAGESKTVSFRIPPFTLEVGHAGGLAVEDGVYEVYVGASSADIRLTGKMRVRGDRFAAGAERSSAYLRNRSNVLSGNYTFGKVTRAGSRGKKTFRAGIVLLAVALASAALLFCLDLAHVIFLFYGDDPFSFYLVLGCPALLIAGLVMLIVGAKRRRAAKNAVVLSEGCLAAAGETAEPERRYEDLFDAAFERELLKGSERAVPVLPKETDETEDAIGQFDPSFTLADAASELTAFCARRGLALGEGGACRLLAAFCASKLVFAETSSARLLPAFSEALGDFFGCAAYFEDVTAYAEQSVSSNAETQEPRQTAAERAFKGAALNRQAVHAAVLGGAEISARTLSGFLSEKFGDAAPNVLFICAAEKLPVCEAETACRIRLELSETAPAGTGGARTLGFYQLTRLSQRCTKEYLLDEDRCWKKIDRLERAAAKTSPFRFGNKTWLEAERFSSALLAMGAEQGEALDEAAAACLIPVISANGGESLSAAEEELDEEHFPESRRRIAAFEG
ncbi:MAG TPA: glycoside hydrolase family 3 C-terminal domain-containing protein [Candidatus Borkfalkia stercoripullorum]|nr:glycoside hydrolase family 3 C-terminal domain-containing protein [Candidatus Borkfalkia stercoripullorum]